MKLIFGNGRYVFLCDINNRWPARDAGFQWSAKESPGVWSTDSARKALKCAQYADDQLRAQILLAAQDEPDPDRIVLSFDGATYRFYSPFQYKDLAKLAGMVGAKHPRWHWWTTDPECAIRVFNNCAQYEGLFECAPELRAQLTQHLEQRNESLEASRALDADIEIPAPPGCEFLPFQRAGIAFALERQNTLIGDEMGLGKTLQAIGFVNAIGAKTVLVVVPASLKLNWQREFEKWDTSGLTVGIGERSYWPKTDVVIINYDALGRESVGGKKVLRREIREVEWDVLIVDESHMIRNPKTQRSKFTTAIKANRKLALSGTAIPNRVRELWPIIHMLAPDVFSDFWPFAKRYCGLERGSFGYDTGGATNLAELQTKLRSTIMVRRLKSEVLKELPAKRRQVIEMPAGNLKRWVDAEQTAFQRHEEMLNELRARSELSKASDDPTEHAQAVEALREGQRVAFTEMSRYRHDTALAKLPLIVEHVTDILEEVPKVLIFAHHVDVIKELASIFKCAYIYGDIPPADRLGIVNDFNTKESERVLVCQSDTAGVGFSVKASHIIFAELEWVPGTMTQCEDRCHGIGRGVEGEPLLVQHLVLEGSLDAQMARTLIAKQEVADRALDRQGGIDFTLDDVDTEFNEENLVLPEKVLACTDNSILQHRPATFDVKWEQIEREAETLSEDEIQQVHSQLKFLASRCDGAASLDGAGFNRFDTAIGKQLASLPRLTSKQAVLGKKLLRKYAGQLSLL